MNEHVDELLPLYALGGLEPDELLRVEAHLPVCDRCRGQADEYAALAQSLTASVPARAPDPRLRPLALMQAQAQPILVPGPEHGSNTPHERRRRPFARLWAPAGLAVVLAVLLGWNVYLTNEVSQLRQQYRAQAAAVALISSPTTQAMHLAGLDNFAASSGRAYVDPDSHNVVLIVENMQPLDPAQTYQAWVITPAGPKNAGLINVSRSGWGLSWLSVPYSDDGSIGVSVEPAGGSQQPSHVVLLSGS